MGIVRARTQVDEMRMGKGNGAKLFVEILIPPKPFERFFRNHPMDINSRHKGPAMVRIKSLEVTI